MEADAVSSDQFSKYVRGESSDCLTTDIKCSFLSKSSDNIDSVKNSVSGESYEDFDNSLKCSVCKTIVTNSITGSTENEYLVDKITKVEFDDVINEEGNIYIFCPECWMVIGHCDENHENKRFYKHLLNLVSKVKR